MREKPKENNQNQTTKRSSPLLRRYLCARNFLVKSFFTKNIKKYLFSWKFIIFHNTISFYDKIHRFSQKMTNSIHFSQTIHAFYERLAPSLFDTEALLAGYSALIKAYNLKISVPEILCAISKKYKKYRTYLADGTFGLAKHAPYDGIIVTACSQTISSYWLEQLAEGARLVLPLQKQAQQYLVRVTRHQNDFQEEQFDPVRFVPLLNKVFKKID